MSDPQIKICEHAYARAKERLGLKRAALDRMAVKAFTSGLTHSKTAGRLKRYLDHLYLEHGKGNNLRIYGRHIYVFQGRHLITVLHLPKEFFRAAQS